MNYAADIHHIFNTVATGTRIRTHRVIGPGTLSRLTTNIGDVAVLQKIVHKFKCCLCFVTFLSDSVGNFKWFPWFQMLPVLWNGA